jgi:PAS domain S-box-containing protein
MQPADFKTIFDASPNAYMLLDRNLRFVAANLAYLRVTGADLDSLLGRGLFDAFPHDPNDPHNRNARLLRESLNRVLESRTADVIAFIPYRVPRERDGGVMLEERFWSATHTPILDDIGEVRLILQHTVDVTELRERRTADARDELGLLHRAQRVQEVNVTLDAERQYLRRLFEQAPGFVSVLHGPKHVFQLVNNAYRQLIGHRDVVGKSVREALPEIEGQGFFKVLDDVYTSGQPFVGRGMAVRLQRHSDAELEERFVDFVYQPIFDAAGSVTGIFVQGHDITAQHQLEAEREALLEQQRFLTESIPQHVWTANAAGELTSVNQRVLEYFNTTAADVLGSGWIRFVHPDDVERSTARWRASLETGNEYEVEFRLRRADGAYLWHLGRAEAIHDTGGEVSRWFGTNTDIDDRKRAQDTLQESAAFEQQLIGIVSHDLRNPINAIGVAAALLSQRGKLDAVQAKAVARIVSSSDRARRLIRDFLDFTQARTSGRLPIAPKPANIRDIARQVFEEVHVSHLDRLASIEHVGEDQGSWDADRIAQVIGNLLSNAFQHSTPDSGVALRTHGTDEEVIIEVQNAGRPIPAGDLARLFLPFERGNGLAPSSERSVGLGLYISKEIIAAHNGTIAVRSTAEEGTVFTVRLPRVLPTYDRLLHSAAANVAVTYTHAPENT